MKCYVTFYRDVRCFDEFQTLVHYADSLPEAIKDGRRYVRQLNHDFGRKVYYYDVTHRSIV